MIEAQAFALALRVEREGADLLGDNAVALEAARDLARAILHPRTATRIVPYGVAFYITRMLLSRSMWFAFTPLPGDMAEFTVKVEAKAWLEGL